MWWNHGDSYANRNPQKLTDPKNDYQKRVMSGRKAKVVTRTYEPNFPEKSLMLQAHRLAIAMVDKQGWILRNQIIWHKPNVMPSSVTDRFTVDYEPIFFFSKSKKYYFERQFDPLVSDHNSGNNFVRPQRLVTGGRGNQEPWTAEDSPFGRNKRAVWNIAAKPFSDAHFATFPEELLETPIKAGCPEAVCLKCGQAREPIFEPSEEYKKHLGKGWHDHQNDAAMGFGQQTRGFKKESLNADYRKVGFTSCNCHVGFRRGIVLDPFMGAGTTAQVSRMLGRNYIGIELNPEYIKIAEKRLGQQVLAL